MDPSRRKPWILWLGLPFVALWLAAQVYDQRPVLAGEPAPSAPQADARAPFALLELFTSEGCSSCPPADALLNEVAADARQRGRPVICLAWHVDYWDQLGWQDAYAQPAFSARQRDYARALGAPSVYTPQMVVNGRKHFVGSSRRQARAELAQALERPAELGFELSLAQGEGAESAQTDGVEGWRELALELRLDAEPPRGARVVACVTERGLESEVARGENAGRHLRHDEVVRAWAELPLSARSGRLKLRVPDALPRAGANLIVFVQAGRGGPVLAARQRTLAAPSK